MGCDTIEINLVELENHINADSVDRWLGGTSAAPDLFVGPPE